MSNEELAIKIKCGQTELYAQLWAQVERFIIQYVYRYYNRYQAICLSHGAEVSDLMQEAYFALVDAVNAYEPKSGYKLLSYIKYPLKNRFAEAVGYRLGKQRNNPLNMVCTSLDVELGESGALISDIIPDHTAEQHISDVEDRLFNNELHNKLDEVMTKALTEKEKNVIVQRFYNKQTLEEIGRRYEQSGSFIRQIERKSIQRLRAPQFSRPLEPFLRWNYMFYHGSVSNFKNTQASMTEKIVENMIDKGYS